jgi:predicted ATPase
MLEACRGDAGATLRAAEALLRVSKEHNMSLHSTYGEIFASWARGCIFDAEGGVSELLQRLGLYRAQGNKATAPLFHGMLAELEAMTGRFDDALASVEAGLALAKETGERWTDPLLFRCKGGILLQHDPVNPTPAEEAFRVAIAVAREQGARSFELRAALALAKLYQLTGRIADAQAVLARALEGFAPTPEMPEIAEAHALMESLA